MDRGEFRDHYEKTSARLYRFLIRLCGDRDTADEILQEAAYLAYRKRRQYRGEGAFSSWLYRIAINAWKAHLKSRSGERKDTGFGEALNHETVSPEAILSGKQTAEKLWEIIEVLDERYRIPFLLRHVDNFSYQEISRILEISENAARVRTYRARHTLREMMKEDGI